MIATAFMFVILVVALYPDALPSRVVLWLIQHQLSILVLVVAIPSVAIWAFRRGGARLIGEFLLRLVAASLSRMIAVVIVLFEDVSALARRLINRRTRP